MLSTTLYIPRVSRVHMGHGEFIKRVFEHQGIAIVKSVDFFEHEIPNAAFGFAIVKIQFWIPCIVSKHFQERLKDASKETRIVFSDPSYWIVLPYTEKQKEQPVKIPPPPIRETPATIDNNCICGCGGGELDCSSQILYNPFTDRVWRNSNHHSDIWAPGDMLTTPLGSSGSSCRNSWTAMNSIEDNFRFCDTPFGFGSDAF